MLMLYWNTEPYRIPNYIRINRHKAAQMKRRTKRAGAQSSDSSGKAVQCFIFLFNYIYVYVHVTSLIFSLSISVQEESWSEWWCVQCWVSENWCSVHLGVKPYACSMCDMRFFQRYHLERHSLTHTGMWCSISVQTKHSRSISFTSM